MPFLVFMMDNLLECWQTVSWGWLEKGCFDGLKYVTLDFSTRNDEGRLGWVKSGKLSSEVYRFLTGVDMARKHGMGWSRSKRGLELREFSIRGVEVDEDTQDSFRFWFGENVRFVEGIRIDFPRRKRQHS